MLYPPNTAAVNDSTMTYDAELDVPFWLTIRHANLAQGWLTSASS